MSTNHIQTYGTFKIGKRDKVCVLGNYQNFCYLTFFLPYYMSTSHIQPHGTFKIGKRDKECVLRIYRNL